MCVLLGVNSVHVSVQMLVLILQTVLVVRHSSRQGPEGINITQTQSFSVIGLALAFAAALHFLTSFAPI